MGKHDDNLMLNAFRDSSPANNSMDDIDLLLEDIEDVNKHSERQDNQHDTELERGAYLDMWARGFSAKGTTSRSGFWGAYIIHIVIASFLYFIDLTTFLVTIYLVVSLLPILAMTMRRLEDAKHSALWVLLLIVPPLSIITLVLCAMPSKSIKQTGSQLRRQSAVLYDDEPAELVGKQIRIVKKSLKYTSHLMFHLTPNQNSRVIAAFTTGLLSRAILNFTESLSQDGHLTTKQTYYLSRYRKLLVDNALDLDIVAKNHMLTLNVGLYKEEEMTLDDFQQQYDNAEEAVFQIADEVMARGKTAVAKQIVSIWQEGMHNLTISNQDTAVLSHGANSLRRPEKPVYGSKSTVGVIILVIIISIATLWVVTSINKNADEKERQALRSAVAVTCKASIDNRKDALYGRGMSSTGVNFNETNEENRIKIEALSKDSDKKEPCLKADNPENDSVVIKVFLNYTSDQDISVVDLLSTDESHLNERGKVIFLESLSFSYDTEIEQRKEALRKIEETSRQYAPHLREALKDYMRDAEALEAEAINK